MTAGRRIVVVGASAAGVAAVTGAREAGWAGEILLVGEESHQPYERPPLSKALLAGTEPHAKTLLSEARATELDVRLLLGRRVTDLDPARRVTIMDDGTEVAAEGVVLATGAQPRDLPGIAGDGVVFLRTLTDATTLLGRLRTARAVAVIGGGFIGLEVAAAARMRGHEVTVIEAAAQPLTQHGDATMGTWLRRRHEDQGVRILTSAQVESVIRDGQGNPAEVGLADGRRVAADLVVVGVGVVPRIDLARRAGVDIDHGIAVDATGRSSNPWVYAAGDVAAHLLGGRRRRVEHWTVAAEQGRAAGRSIAGQATAWRSVPYFWSDQFDLSLQMFGLPSAGDTVITRRATDDGAVWAWVGRGRVTAVAAVNSPVDARAGRQLLAAGGHADLDRLGDPSADLRTIGSDPAPTAG